MLHRHYWLPFTSRRAAEHFLANVRGEHAEAQLELRWHRGQGWWGRLSITGWLRTGDYRIPAGAVLRREQRWGRPVRLPSERRRRT